MELEKEIVHRCCILRCTEVADHDYVDKAGWKTMDFHQRGIVHALKSQTGKVRFRKSLGQITRQAFSKHKFLRPRVCWDEYCSYVDWPNVSGEEGPIGWQRWSIFHARKALDGKLQLDAGPIPGRDVLPGARVIRGCLRYLAAGDMGGLESA